MRLIKKRTKQELDIIKGFLEDYDLNWEKEYYILAKENVEKLEKIK
jgi:hypothetical protein